VCPSSGKNSVLEGGQKESLVSETSFQIKIKTKDNARKCIIALTHYRQELVQLGLFRLKKKG
jgi:hypothetical protein